MTDTTGDEIRRMFRDHENAMARLVNQVVAPIKEDLAEIKAEVKKTNGRVTHIEEWRIARNAREGALAEAAATAANVVAEKAATALNERERSKKWWITVIGLGFTAITVGTPLVGAALDHLT